MTPVPERLLSPVEAAEDARTELIHKLTTELLPREGFDLDTDAGLEARAAVAVIIAAAVGQAPYCQEVSN